MSPFCELISRLLEGLELGGKVMSIPALPTAAQVLPQVISMSSTLFCWSFGGFVPLLAGIKKGFGGCGQTSLPTPTILCYDLCPCSL